MYYSDFLESLSKQITLETSSGSALLALLLAGYLAQKYGLPPPPPKIAAIDLGTTFSSIGIYQAVTGATDIIADDVGRKSIPSVVAFLLVDSLINVAIFIISSNHRMLSFIKAKWNCAGWSKGS